MHLRTGYHFVALLYLVSGEDWQFLARQMQDAATLSEEQAEKKEVKREEFSDEGQGATSTGHNDLQWQHILHTGMMTMSDAIRSMC